MLLRPGDIVQGTLDDYQIAATISRGAYGCAFRARTSTGEWRVIKQFEPTEALSAPEEDYQRRCFEREAGILTRFRSPMMVRGDELVERDDEAFLVMEHVDGQTLRALLDQRLLDTGEPFPPAVAAAIALQLCAVIDELHHFAGTLIYRDLKPSNVMWDAAARRLKLIDFGTARFNADEQQATQGLGTEGYAPPELYGSRIPLSPATDVYTIGAVLYELLTGATPPDRATPADFRGREVPPGLAEVVRRAMHQEPADRYPTARAMAEALSAAVGVPDEPPLRVPLRNHHPLLACFCPRCGAEPAGEQAVYCGRDGALYHVGLLRLVPRHRPACVVYLDRAEAVLGRNDPEQGHFPEIDLTAADPARHVSRRHATIRRRGTRFELTSHAATNPTRIDGVPAEPETCRELRPGARLELADLVATLVVRPVLEAAPAGAGR